MTLEKLYKEYNSDLRTVLTYLGLNAYDADDTAQDFYIKIYTLLESPDKYPVEKKGAVNKTYLFSVVRNMVTDDRRKVNPIVEQDIGHFKHIANYDEDERLNDLDEAVASIDDDYDRVLLQVYLDRGHSIRSLEKATGITRTKIFTSLRRSKEFVKQELLKNE